MTNKTLTTTTRIIAFLQAKKISKRSFEEAIGASNGLINRARREGASIGSQWLEAIAQTYPEVSMEWLIAGRGAMLNTTNQRESTPSTPSASEPPATYNMKEPTVDHQLIPYYNITATAGILQQIFTTSQQVDSLIQIPNAPKCDGAMPMTGDSMYPILKAGDIVAFKRINNLEYISWGQMYIVDFSIDGDDYISIKWLKKSEKGDDHIQLVSENRHHDPVDIPRSCIRSLAIVKATIRYHANG